ncbi:MAG TPA: PilZ domain-containing protein [Nitrospirota bacterium]|nr:PilZ domain-containing protein [Nitrospirota bacterium]
MTDAQRTGPPEGPTGEFIEKRLEERFRVLPVYQRYITLRVKSGDEFMPCVLGDFSKSGILFVSQAPFEADSHADCVVSIPSLLSKEVKFGIHVKYCLTKEGSSLVGAAIDTVADKMWFDIFAEIHDYIVQRQDDVY